MRSIRANLVLWLVSALVVGVLAVLAATYALTRNEVGRLFDEELRQVALAVHLRLDWEQPSLRIARPGFSLSLRAYDDTGRVHFESALPSLPADLPQTFAEGFRTIATAQGPWRVFTHVAEEGIVQVGQPLETRDALARDVTFRALIPMALLIPLVALVTPWALRRGLRPLAETSRRVSDRDAARLDPLPDDNVPTELLPLVGQINALLARLSAQLDADRRFLADAAHELRSPVAALALQVQLAARAQTPPARAAALHELSRGIERARRLVQQLLDFARFEPGVTLEPFEELDLAALARATVGLYAARADERGVDLGADAEGPARLLGSEAELRSLIENLVDNALRYSPEGTSVTVAVRRLEHDLELSVVDEGPGIPSAERTRVFERFYRVAGDPTAGSGLGLSIVRAIVERHQGTIELGETHPGLPRPGLAVRVRFPALETVTAPALSVA
ncbi:MAG TPA: ATP-binding protein [Burkholderiales bacterium]|nr:ATP-binding protein [Burkholderiales bacterium]